MWKPAADTQYWIAEGRNPVSESTGHCGNPRAAEVASQRQLVPLDVCGNKESPCPLREKCSESGYLHAKMQAQEARLVLATKAAYLNGSEALGTFDLVILDEDASEWLLETVEVTATDTNLWRKLLVERDTEQQLGKLEHFVAWLQRAADHAKSRTQRGREMLALEALRATAPADAETVLKAAIGSCTDMASKNLPRALCETPVIGEPVPLRAIYDLAITLLEEWGRPEGADSRLRFNASGSLVLRRPRHRLLDALAQQRVLFLDATADLPLIQRMASFTDTPTATQKPVSVHVHELTVATNVEVWQVTDGLYGLEALRRNAFRELRAIAQTIEAHAQRRGITDLKRVGVLSRLPFDPNSDEQCEDGAFAPFTTGHYGKDDKATDRFKDCQILATVGNYTPNIGGIEAKVAAWRYAEQPPRTHQTPHVDRYPGTHYGIERESHPDPDVQAAIEQATWMHETQALGRLRAIRRPGQRLLWIRFNRSPYPSLPVTRVMTYNDLRAEHGLPPTEKFGMARLNALRGEREREAGEALSKCQRAYEELVAAGKPVTETAMRRATGVRRDAVRRFLATLSASPQIHDETRRGDRQGGYAGQHKGFYTHPPYPPRTSAGCGGR